MSAFVIWLLIAIILIGMELWFGVFVFCFFALGALAAAVVSWFTPSIPLSIGVACIVAICSLLALRSRLMQAFHGKSKATGRHDGSICPYIGETAKVTKDIAPDKIGEIFLSGSFWQAEANENIEVDKMIEVINWKENNQLILMVKSI